MKNIIRQIGIKADAVKSEVSRQDANRADVSWPDADKNGVIKHGGRIGARMVARKQAQGAAARRTVHGALAVVFIAAMLGIAWLAIGMASPRSHAQDAASDSSASTASPSDASSSDATPSDGPSSADAGTHPSVSTGTDTRGGSDTTGTGMDADFAVHAWVEGTGYQTGPVAFQGRKVTAFGKDGAPAQLRITVSTTVDASDATSKDAEHTDTDTDQAGSGRESGNAASSKPMIARLHVPAPKDLDGNVIGKATVLEASLADSDSATFTITAEGMYIWSDFSVEIIAAKADASREAIQQTDTDQEDADHTDTNQTETNYTQDTDTKQDTDTNKQEQLQTQQITQPLTQVLKDSHAKPDGDAVILDQGGTPHRGLAVSVTRMNDDESAASAIADESADGAIDAAQQESGYYFSTPVKIGLEVTDRWFAFYQTAHTTQQTAHAPQILKGLSEGADSARESDWTKRCTWSEWTRASVAGTEGSVDADHFQDSADTLGSAGTLGSNDPDSRDAQVHDTPAPDAQVSDLQLPESQISGEQISDVWVAECRLDEVPSDDPSGESTDDSSGTSAAAMNATALHVHEGTYRYTAEYQGLLGDRNAVHACHEVKGDMPACEFVIDVTPPMIGAIHLEGDYGRLGDWLRVRPGFRIIVSDVADARSGLLDARLVCAEANECGADGTAYVDTMPVDDTSVGGMAADGEVLATGAALTGGSASVEPRSMESRSMESRSTDITSGRSTLTVSFAAGEHRWDATHLGIRVRDKAGNVTTVTLADALARSNAADATPGTDGTDGTDGADDRRAEGGSALTGVNGIVMQTDTPSISVRHEECGTAAGYCSRAPRVVVQMRDATLDIIQRADPGRVVAVAVIDGRVVHNVLARDLQLSCAPSGPGGGSVSSMCVGVTGTYAFVAESDGQWDVTAWASPLPGAPGSPTNSSAGSSAESSVHSSADSSVGTPANASHVSFVVDTHAPRLTMTLLSPPTGTNHGPMGTNHGIVNSIANGTTVYISGSVQVLVGCTERNPQEGIAQLIVDGRDPSGVPVHESPTLAWTQTADGQWSATFSWSREGTYSMHLEAIDKADNSAMPASIPRFTLDSTAPVISIGGVEDSHAYAGDVRVTIRVDEPLLDGGVDWGLVGVRRGDVTPRVDVAPSSTGETLTFEDFVHDRAHDDVYELQVSAHDRAGNATSRRVRFSINRFGSTYAFPPGTQAANGTFLRAGRQMEIDEINASGLKSGSTNIRVACGDSVRMLETGEYETVVGESGGWSLTRYVIPADAFAQDGWYRVLVASTDEAGNHSDNARLGAVHDGDATASAELTFAVDSTPPQAHVGAAGTIHVHDAMAMDHVELRVDGTTAKQWKADTADDADGASAGLPQDGRTHDVRVIATDKAGNIAEAQANVQAVQRGWMLPGGAAPSSDGATTYQGSGSLFLAAALAVAIGVPSCTALASRMMRRKRGDDESGRMPGCGWAVEHWQVTGKHADMGRMRGNHGSRFALRWLCLRRNARCRNAQ